MPELTLTAPPPRAELLRQLRERLGEALPGVRIVAEGLLGADARIDFVGVEPDGGVALVLVGDLGQDLELVARGLAQRDWVALRLPDWAQLAPQLGLRPDAELQLLLLCPEFRHETRAAAEALGGHAPRLAVYRCVRNGAGVQALIEPLDAAGVASRGAASATPGFRTGLRDADLDLSPEEQREFE